MRKKLLNFEKVSIQEQEEILKGMTLSNIVKFLLLSNYPDYIQRLGFKLEETSKILEESCVARGVSSCQGYDLSDNQNYPFPRPVSETFFNTLVGGDIELSERLETIIEQKYQEGGRALAYLDKKLNDTVNNGLPTAYIAVSTKLDLLTVLASLQKGIWGKKMELPIISEEEARKNPEFIETNLVEGTEAHKLYRYIIGDTSIKPTASTYSSYPIDAIVAVTPRAKGFGIPIRVYRRKTPESIGLKFGYSIASHLVFHSHVLFPQKQKPGEKEWRGKKYWNHEDVGAQDVYGALGFLKDPSSLKSLFSNQGLDSLFLIRSQDPIATVNEVHYDINIIRELEFITSHIGRTEYHAIEEKPENYIRSQIIGSNAWLQWKQQRGRELDEIFPGKKGLASNLMEDISRETQRTILRPLRVAHYPGYFMVSFSTDEADLPKKMFSFHHLEKAYGKHLEGRYTLHNVFPFS